MPRLSAVPRTPPPPGGYAPSPIDPNWDRCYILDANGKPERVFDTVVHTLWQSFEGRGYQIKDTLPEYNAEVWTYFSGWASKHNDKPPMFRTLLRIGGFKKDFESETWEQAEDKHRRVIEKLHRKNGGGVSDGD